MAVEHTSAFDRENPIIFAALCLHGRRLCHLSYLSLVILFILAGVCTGTRADSTLDSRLASIETRATTGSDLATLERECLDMLPETTGSTDKGKIYAQLAAIYCRAKGSQRSEKKLIHYCKKALEHPLEVQAAARIYVCLVGTSVSVCQCQGDELAKGRRELAVIILNGLKLLLDYGVPSEYQPVPGVDRFNYDGPLTDPEYQRLIKRHDQQCDARRKAMAMNDLVFVRKGLMIDIISCYARQPYATEELKQLAESILKNDGLVHEILAQITVNGRDRSGRSGTRPAEPME